MVQGTDNPTYDWTYDLLRGLRGLMSAVIIWVSSTHEPPLQCGGPHLRASGLSGLGFRVEGLPAQVFGA